KQRHPSAASCISRSKMRGGPGCSHSQHDTVGGACAGFTRIDLTLTQARRPASGNARERTKLDESIRLRLTMKTEAMVLRRHGGPEVLTREMIDLPDPGPREIRVRV